MRISPEKAAPGVQTALYGLVRYLRESGLEPSLLNLIDLRASQINGCAYCVDMHTKDARSLGETEQRLYAVSVWRDTPFFTPRERAALEWTESVTKLEGQSVPDQVFQSVRPHFSDKELVDLTLAVIAINSWNRLNIAFRREAGDYQPPTRHAASSTTK